MQSRARPQGRPPRSPCLWAAWRGAAALVFASVWLVAAPAAAEMYRWVDREGRTHYGSQPPAEARKIERLDAPSAESQINIVPEMQENTSPPAPRRETDSARRLRLLEEAEPDRIDGRSESWWRSRALQLEQGVEELERDLAYAEDQLSSAYALGRAAYYQRRVDRLKQRLEAKQRELDDFEDRARELGVPPGWLR